MASPKQSSAYTAFNAVDDLVAKPVLGSDGAAKWQDFRHQQKKKAPSASSAPTAPLKKSDRAAGFASWREERDHADKIRAADGSAEAGVNTNFKKTQADGVTAKERKRIERRLIGEEQEYFIPSAKFAGWKFDYVFTTKLSHGTGYYFDGMDSLKKLRGELTSNTTSKDGGNDGAEVSVRMEASERNTNDSIDAQPPRQKKRKAAVAAAAVTIVDDPTHPREQVAAALAKHDAASQALRLPPGWECAVADGSTAATQSYYYNRTTGERTWEKPSVWSVATDPAAGKPYYYNVVTGVTVWEKPDG